MSSLVVPYRIETPRFVLRALSPDDAVAVKEAEDASREHLKRFMIWAHQEQTLDDVVAKLRGFRAAFDRSEDFFFGAWEKQGQAMVGGCGLHPRVMKGGLEIGYWTHAAHGKKGVATEMAAALTRTALEITKARWVEIRCATSNVASMRIPPKLGYELEATLRDRIELPTGGLDDALCFTLFGGETYAKSAARQVPIEAYDAARRPYVLTA